MMSMDMTWVIILLGVLLMVLVAVPLVGMHLLAAREDRGHHSRKEVQQERVSADIDALQQGSDKRALES